MILLSVPGAAGAQGSEELIRSQAHANAAAALFRQGSYAAALGELTEANDLVPAPIYLFNIARCHEEMGHLTDAVEQYERFLAVAEDERRKERARRTVARLVPKAFGAVEVACSQEGARVVLEGFEERGCPCLLERVRPGVFGLTVRAPGYTVHEERVRAEAGTVTRVTVELSPAPDEPGMRVALGRLAVTSEPDGAEARLDGDPLGRTPTGAVEVDAGFHVLEVEAPWRAAWIRQVEVPKGESVTAHAELASRHVALGLAGSALVAAAGAGVAFGMALDAEGDQDAAAVAYGRATDPEDALRHGDDMYAAYDRVGSAQLVGRVLAGVAAALAAGSAACFLWPSGAEGEQASVGPTFRGLAVSRSW